MLPDWLPFANDVKLLKLQSLCIIRATVPPFALRSWFATIHRRAYCTGVLCFSYVPFRLTAPNHSPPHDEFSGARKVSLVNGAGMMTWINRLRLAGAAWALLVGTGAAPAADDVSRWDGDARSAARLIAASRPAGETTLLRAGIELRLKAGWHTYWRYPGDAGVPPQFDFKGSQNVQGVEVLWPAPQRLPEDGGISIGYEHDMILPLRIVPQDRAKPVVLRLKLDYAVCEKLCVPAEAKAELALPGGASSQDTALAAAEARVPKKLKLG